MATPKEDNQKILQISVDKEDVIHVSVVELISDRNIWEVMQELEVKFINLSQKAKVIINLTNFKIIQTPFFRKKIAERFKFLIDNLGIKKIAFWGGTVITRTMTSFVITASRTKIKAKVFKTEQKALSWLRRG